MSDKYEPRFFLLGQSACSPYAEGVNEGTSYSGLWGDLDSNFGDLIEGGIVLDKRTCADADLVRWVVSGPMHDRSLPPKSRKGWDGIEPWDDARTAGGWAYVSTDLFLDLWRSLGARIGKRVGMQIVWEDGATEQIRKASERYPWQRVEAPAA